MGIQFNSAYSVILIYILLISAFAYMIGYATTQVTIRQLGKYRDTGWPLLRNILLGAAGTVVYAMGYTLLLATFSSTRDPLVPLLIIGVPIIVSMVGLELTKHSPRRQTFITVWIPLLLAVSVATVLISILVR